MTDCDKECRQFAMALVSPTDVAKRLNVTMRHITDIAIRLNLGIIVTGRRIYTEEDIRAIERHRAKGKYGPKQSPRTRAEQIDAQPRTPVVLSDAYLEQIKRLRGEA